ncbi:MAG: Replicative DNA helicase (EC [uncultured Paraburkholderia sp.]|nr:MAG: Replicative DNA helicase (EC [uncultured Paraburkholderia sp.]
MNAPDRFIDGRNASVPPHSVGAEQSILGALLSDNDAIDRIANLKPEHFYRYDHRLIFQAISAMIVSNRRADLITVYERLSTSGHADEVGGLSYLNSLAQNAPSSAGIVRWAEIVIDRWRLRGVIAAADEISAMAYNRDARLTVADIINQAQSKFEPLAEVVSTDPKMIGEFLSPIVERIDQEFHGANARADAVPTGLTDLDAKLNGGMHGGQLIVIAGRPGMGKTAIALGVAEAVADAGKASAVFSQEMLGDELCSRALSRASGLPLEKILDGRKFGRADDHPDWPMLTKGVQRVAELNLIVDDRPALSLAAIRSAARMIKRRHGLGLIVVDYLGLMACTEGNNRNEQVGPTAAA